MKKNLYVISGATGMTGSELSHQLLKEDNIVVGFDNFFASSIDTVKDLVGREDYIFFEYDINNAEHMAVVADKVIVVLGGGKQVFAPVFRVLGFVQQTGEHDALQLLSLVVMFFQFAPSGGEQVSCYTGKTHLSFSCFMND